MSHELDAQVAERVMGWTKIDRDGLRQGWGNQPAWDGGTIWARVPMYSSDLNACALAEAHMLSLGLTGQYAKALERILYEASFDAYLMGGAAGSEHIDYHAAFLFATASPEIRCRAMLRALDGVK